MEYFIYDDKIKLKVYLDKPENTDKCPLCLIFHGFTGYSEEYHLKEISKAMNEVGVATLRVDLYGHGQSEGEFRNHTLFKWISNALCAFDHAKSLDFVTEIYISGHSQGGLLAMLVAPMVRESVKFLIPLSPAIIIPRGAKEGNLLGTPFDPDNVPYELHTWNRNSLGSNYIRVAQTIDTDQAIKAFKGRVLIIHGDDDGAVPISDSRDAASKYADCRLVAIEGDDHCYGHHLDKVKEAVKEGILEYQGRA